jgi:hypothetical protein
LSLINEEVSNMAAYKYPALGTGRFFANYGIPDDRAGQRTKLVIIVAPSNYFSFNNVDVAGNVQPVPINQTDTTESTLRERDDIGKIDMLIADIQHKGIRIPEPPKLKYFLSNFPDIIEILPEVCNLTMERFPDNAQLSLELDGDIGGNELILYIRQEYYEENIMDIIDDIRARYSERLIGKKGWLVVTTDFNSPE